MPVNYLTSSIIFSETNAHGMATMTIPLSMKNKTKQTKMKKEDERVYTTNCRIFDLPGAAMEVSKCHSFEFTY